MSSVSGLSDVHRDEVRRIVVRGCELLLANTAAVHYSQGPDRWEGIVKRLHVTRGQFPKHGDCSSTATWLLWNGLVAHFPDHPVRDVVNGLNWTAGFTGTMLNHGKLVHHRENVEVGDLILYGSGGNGKHVAVCVGGGKAFSHGSEAGPFKVDLDYRSDIMCIRRYI